MNPIHRFATRFKNSSLVPAILVLGFMAALPGTTLGLEPRTEHTFKLAEGEDPPTATLEDVAWLAGSWSGEAFGQQFEEVWNPPSAGSMVGLFKLMNEEGVSMYEILLMTIEDGRPSLKVKHFNRDFSAWEEKADYVNFRFVGLEENAIHFSGISFYRHGPDEMTGYLVMKYGEEIREEKLTYNRVKTQE